LDGQPCASIAIERGGGDDREGAAAVSLTPAWVRKLLGLPDALCLRMGLSADYLYRGTSGR
jgi:hypothetical protein